MTSTYLLRLRPYRTAIFLLGLFTALTSCEKPENEIGIDVQPEEDQLNVVFRDTTTLITSTIYSDSIPTSGLSKFQVGSYTDPQFGYVETSFFSQVLLSAFLDTIDVGNTAVDSVVLQLVLDSEFYGFRDEQVFRVYEMNEFLSEDSIYYSNRTVDYLPTDLIKSGYNNVTPDPFNGYPIGNGDTLNPMLRFRLEESFGMDILAAANNGDLASQENFTNFFKGIYVYPDNNVPPVDYGGVFRIDPLATQTNMTIYYRNTTPGAEDTLLLTMNIGEDAVYGGKFITDATGTNVETHINNPSLGQTNVFIQSLGGTRGVVKLPFLQSFIDSGMVGINKAELVLQVDDTLTTDYLPHDRLLALAIPADGGAGEFLPDFFEGDNHFDGFWDVSTNTYRIKVTRWLQHVLTGQLENHGLYIISTSSGVNANRTVLHGPEDGAEKMKLEVYFTNY